MGDHKSSKDRHSKHKKHKKKHKKEEKKEKSHKKRRSYSSDSDSSSSGGSDVRPSKVDVTTQLAMGRAAARAIREILAYNYDLRTDIRQLARHLDSGNALDISGLGDAFLRTRLCTLFDNLIQLRKTSAGHYMLVTKSSTVTSFVAPFLEESPSSLASYAAASAPQPTAGGPTVIEDKQQPPTTAAKPSHDIKGDNTAIAAETRPLDALKKVNVDLPHQRSPAEPAGPSMQRKPADEGFILEPPTIASVEEEEIQPPRRVLGPAMPPPEVLEAAAAIPVPLDDHFPKAALPLDDEFIVGPPPPEYLVETDAASMNDRSAEVARVMEVLRQHEAEGVQLAVPTAAGAAPAPHPPDAYLVLNVDPSAPTGEIKKRYWKLSLLIHPDKCDHPQAPVAFQAVASAAQVLQDAGAREAVDKRREEAELRRFTQEFAAQQERERQWRIAQGKATAEDLAGPAPMPGVAEARQSWMTDLPEVRNPSAAPPQGNQTAFSSRGPVVRGDTSGWTMTPQERAAAAAGGRLEDGSGIGAIGPAAGPGALMPGGADMGKTAHTAAAVDAYTTSLRGKSLLEQHLEKQEKGKKVKSEGKKGGKKRKKESGGDKDGNKNEDEDWDREAHPWRPFDRERDLEIKPSGASDPKELLKNMKGLSSRFAGSSGRGGGSSGGRSFL